MMHRGWGWVQALPGCQHVAMPPCWRFWLGWLQGSCSMHPVLRLLSFSLYWLLSAPHWIACWAYFTCGEGALLLLLRDAAGGGCCLLPLAMAASEEECAQPRSVNRRNTPQHAC